MLKFIKSFFVDDNIQEEEKHIHEFYKSIGTYYKLYLASNEKKFDEVRVYDRRFCLCGEHEDVLISTDQFLPKMYHNDIDEKVFINKIEKIGIEGELEFNLKTNTISRRDDDFWC